MAGMGVNYYDPAHPGSLSGVDKLYRSQKGRNRDDIKEWLRSQDAYTLHKRVLYKFKRNKVVVGAIDQQWDADLMDFSHQPDDDYHYVLVAIDILSRYVWTRSLKNKSGNQVASAFESIFKEGRKPQKLRTDRGTEFLNKISQKMFKKYDVIHFPTNNEVKASFAERVIKTLKLRLSRYSTYKQSSKWKDVIRDITTSYNNTYHRVIKRKPSSVSTLNQAETWLAQYTKHPPPDGAYKLKVGDTVRISHLRRVFQREYDIRYTGEVFTIKSRKTRGGLNIYTLIDLLNEDVKGTFYEPELQRVRVDPQSVYKIDKVLRTRHRRGKQKESLIRWRYHGPKFDSWVKSAEIEDI